MRTCLIRTCPRPTSPHTNLQCQGARLRILLQSGTAVEATVASSRRKFGIHPPQLRVEYTFRDGASTRHGSHLVGRRTTLGKLIEAGAETVPAVFDPSDPNSSRLALHEDFVA